jgi:hypothetical protein
MFFGELFCLQVINQKGVINMASVGQELLNVPFGDMVLQLAGAIAEGQYKLDRLSCEIAKMMGKETISLPSLEKDKELYTTTMLGAGFQPTFYQFTDTIIEVKMAITMAKSHEASVSTSAKAGIGCFSASVNASYTGKYSYSVEGSSLLRTKITPVPPNSFLERYLEIRTEMLQGEMKQKMDEAQRQIENSTTSSQPSSGDPGQPESTEDKKNNNT